MGWSRGSQLMSEIITALEDNINTDDKSKELFYTHIIEAFEDLDCDTLGECLGESTIFDKAYHNFHPNIDDDGYFEQEYENDGC